MTALNSCIFAGTVVHKRLSPTQHGFSYRVFALCLDVDEIDLIDQRLRLFSRGKRNLISFVDADVGEVGKQTVGEKARRLLASAGLSKFSTRIELVCYPRLLGYVFNPLSVYFCYDVTGKLGVLIYEVSNTFGERKCYVLETAGRPTGAISQSCPKELYVSPFTEADGTYSFHVIPPSDRVVVGVALRDSGRATLKTHFRGDRIELTDKAILRMFCRHPLMTLKVVGAIHYEAARLWMKGVPLVNRHTSPPYSFTIVRSQSQDIKHA